MEQALANCMRFAGGPSAERTSCPKEIKVVSQLVDKLSIAVRLGGDEIMPDVSDILKDLQSIEAHAETGEDGESQQQYRPTAELAPASSLWCTSLTPLFQKADSDAKKAVEDKENIDNTRCISFDDCTEDQSFVPEEWDPRSRSSMSEDAAVGSRLFALAGETFTEMRDRVCRRRSTESVSVVNSISFMMEETVGDDSGVQSVQELSRGQLREASQHSNEQRLRSTNKTVLKRGKQSIPSQQRKEMKGSMNQAPSQDWSQELASDMSDYMESVRRLDQDQSYDSASFRDFEASLNHCIFNHFLDDEGDSFNQTLSSSLTSQSPESKAGSPTSPATCNSHDEAYWADRSRGYGSEDSAIRDVAAKILLIKDNSDRTALPVRRRLAILPDGPNPKDTMSESSPEEGIYSIQSQAVITSTDNALNESMLTIGELLGSTKVRPPSIPTTNISTVSNGSDESNSNRLPVDDSKVNSVEVMTGRRSRDPPATDGSTDDFLVNKLNRLSLLMETPEETPSYPEEVTDEVHSATGTELFENGETYSIAFEQVQKGRALIRKIQRRRKAAIQARQVEEQSQHGLDKMSSPSPQSVQAKVPIINEPREDVETTEVNLAEEIRLENMLVGWMPRASSRMNSSAMEVSNQKTGKSHAKESRQSVFPLRSLLKSKALADALQESMDTALERETMLQTGSLQRNIPKKNVDRSRHPAEISIRKKNRGENTRYQVLSDADSTTETLPQPAQSDYILEAEAPPSYDSPFHKNQLDGQPIVATDSIACLHEVAACELSDDDGQLLVFDSDTDHSGNHSKDPTYRTAKKKKYLDDRSDDEIFVNIRKKSSPTSIVDFFGDPEPFFEEEDSEEISDQEEGGAIPFLLHQEDDFWSFPVDWTMSRDETLELQRRKNVRFAL